MQDNTLLIAGAALLIWSILLFFIIKMAVNDAIVPLYKEVARLRALAESKAEKEVKQVKQA